MRKVILPNKKHQSKNNMSKNNKNNKKYQAKHNISNNNKNNNINYKKFMLIKLKNSNPKKNKMKKNNKRMMTNKIIDFYYTLF